MIALNCGSGQRPFHSTDTVRWINVDLQEKWGADVVSDIRSMPMFADNSADLIVAHHSYEHLLLQDSEVAIKEAYRILKPGGSLLVFVPELAALAAAWLRGDINDFIYTVNIYGAFNGDPADSHRWGWSKRSLSAHVLKSAPWSNLKLFDWRDIPGGDFARDWWIQAQEAVK